MPQTIESVTHYRFGVVLVEDAVTGQNLADTVVTVTDEAGAVLSPRELEEPFAVISPFQTNKAGRLPAFYAPATVVNLDAGQGLWAITSTDVAGLAQSAADSAAAAVAAQTVVDTLRDDALALVDDLKAEDDPLPQYILASGSVRVKHAYGTTLPAASSMPGTIFTVIPSLP